MPDASTAGNYGNLPPKKVHDSLIFEKMMRDKMRKLGPLDKNSKEYRNASFRKTANQ